MQHPGAFPSLTGDKLKVTPRGVKQHRVNTVPKPVQPHPRIHGVGTVIAGPYQQQHTPAVRRRPVANEGIVCFFGERIGGALHQVAVIVGCLHVWLFGFADAFAGVDEFHGLSLGWCPHRFYGVSPGGSGASTVMR